MSVAVRVVDSVDELSALAPAWEELAVAAEAGPFSFPSWCLPWWRRAGKGELFVVVAESDGSLVGLAPFHVRKAAGAQIVRFLGHAYGAPTGVLLAPGDEDAAEALWSAVLSHHLRALQLFEYVRDPSRQDVGLAALTEVAGATCSVEPSDTCPVIRPDGSLDDYLTTRSKSLRKTLRRADRLLEQEGVAWEPEVVTEPGAVDAVLPDVRVVFDAAERARSRQHLLEGEAGDFTTDLLRTSAAAGRLRLVLGRIGGSLASIDICLTGAHSIGVWAGRFHPNMRRFAPGHLSLRTTVGQAIDEGIPEIDLLLGDDTYKHYWATGHYTTVAVRGASTRAVARAARWAETAIGRYRHRRVYGAIGSPPSPEPAAP